ncbi:MAG: AAA family ATPase [Acidobacteria bacterium]|nr:MAG: AAA family ATPase [Acidobacteriota bacterium]
MSTKPQTTTDDLELLLSVLPEGIRAALDRLNAHDDLLEVVLDLGRLPEARFFPARVEKLSDRPVSAEVIARMVERVGAFGRDNRAGIERTLHRISALRNRSGGIVGLTCRVGRAVYGTIDIVRDVVERGDSMLLLGRPGVGKTTLLREAARVLADELGKRVMVVDTSNEIAGDGDIPHPGIGSARRMQVPSPDAQHAVMIEAVENHMPEVIVIDEIGTQAETLAARTIAERGVQLIATAHGNTLDNLMQNPTLADLVGGIHAVTLSDEEARRRGTQKTVLERKAPPTFEVLIEIQSKEQLAVYDGVAEVVDRRLRGVETHPEVRHRTAAGEVEIIAPAPVTNDVASPLPAAGPASPWRVPRRFKKGLRIFPFAVSRRRLERAIAELGVTAKLVEQLDDADVVLTLKAQERRQPQRLRDAEMRGVRIAVIKSNTSKQIERFLRRSFDLGDAPPFDFQTPEVEHAIDEVLRAGKPVALEPQNRFVRRLQHELIQSAGLASESAGDEPQRRVVVYPP